jgi:hypothetical protein
MRSVEKLFEKLFSNQNRRKKWLIKKVKSF